MSIFLRFTLEIEHITPISKKYIESHKISKSYSNPTYNKISKTREFQIGETKMEDER